MPSGKTHDAITAVLAIPTFAIAYAVSNDVWLSSIIAVGFLFGGLMFGPDLDTLSTQYSRWKFFRLLWFPYRTYFKHRSRWSHGLIFGTFFRVVYFMGVLTCVAFLAAWSYSAYDGGKVPGFWDVARTWTILREYSNAALGENGVIWLFGGMWIGAASHTFTDLAGTYVKTGRASL